MSDAPVTAEAERPPVHMMIDLETFGVGERAAIIQVGLCAFNPDAVVETNGDPGELALDGEGELPGGASQEWNVTLQSAMLLGGEIDPGTVEFWRKQPPAAQEAVGTSGWSIRHVLDNVRAFHALYKPERVWCHGATFDVPIIDGYYRRAGQASPWRYSQPRCTRTAFEDAAEFAGWERPDRGPTAHLGRADAIAQAKDLQLARHALRNIRRAT